MTEKNWTDDYKAALSVETEAVKGIPKAVKRQQANAGLECLKKELSRKRKEANILKRKLATSERSRKEAEEVADLFRAHLDDSAEDAEDDNEWEQEARRITWNKLDVDNQQQEARIWSMSGKRL